jgi:hypothetical protein
VLSTDRAGTRVTFASDGYVSGRTYDTL